MYSVVIPKFGEPEVLDVRELPAPQPGPGQVAIDVAFAGVNYAEVLFRRGVVDLPLPFVPGIEVAGYVRALGPDVQNLRVGQPVAALTIVDGGGYAEIVIAPAPLVFPLDDLDGQIDLATAAAFPSNVTTAFLVLSEVAHIRPGESVIVHAAAGGVGSAMGQMARCLGAGLVVGTVGSPDKIEYAMSLGYDKVFLREDFSTAARAETGRSGFDIILDQVGGVTRTQSLALLNQLGRLVVMGNASSAEDVQLSANQLWFTSKAVLGFNLQAFSKEYPERVNAAARKALQLVARGKVRVDVTDVLPLEQAAEAHRRIEQRATTGKLVLRLRG
jgi:NADPH2:quinone reductase